MKRELLAGDYLQVDETPVRVWTRKCGCAAMTLRGVVIASRQASGDGH
jgi:hypothetical protein